MAQTINVRKRTVQQLIKMIDQGRFAIPKLQREFVWDGPKAAKLLDSILNHMPVGVVMLWETKKSSSLFLRQRFHVLPPFNSKHSKILYLIDGQQRVSVIHHVREGTSLKNSQGRKIDFQKVVFALEPQTDGAQIRYRRPVAGRFISLSDILHPQYRQRCGELGTRDMKKVVNCRNQIMSYPMHLMFVQTKIDEIRETFLRINTQGMKITTADAIFTRAQELNLRDFRHQVLQNIDEQFGQVPMQPILYALSATQGGSEARGQALEAVIDRLEKRLQDNKRGKKQLARDLTRLSQCFGKAVDYLRSNFHVLNRDYLYSDYMLAQLALFFFWNRKGPSAEQKKQINKWFWCTAVGSRYSGQNFMKCIPEDQKFFQRLSENPRSQFRYEPQVDQVDVRKSLYASKTGITTAFYCMLLRLGPVSIADNGLNEIPLERYSASSNRKDRHHIFPRGRLAPAGVHAQRYNSIANICLLTAAENQSIGSKVPRKYLDDCLQNTTYFEKKMDRHLIPVHEDSGVWQRSLTKGFNSFLKERSEMICQELESQAGCQIFRRN